MSQDVQVKKLFQLSATDYLVDSFGKIYDNFNSLNCYAQLPTEDPLDNSVYGFTRLATQQEIESPNEDILEAAVSMTPNVFKHTILAWVLKCNKDIFYDYFGAKYPDQLNFDIDKVDGYKTWIPNIHFIEKFTADFLTKTEFNSVALKKNEDVLPSENKTFNIGNQDKQWNDLYIQNANIEKSAFINELRVNKLFYENDPGSFTTPSLTKRQVPIKVCYIRKDEYMFSSIHNVLQGQSILENFKGNSKLKYELFTTGQDTVSPLLVNKDNFKRNAFYGSIMNESEKEYSKEYSKKYELKYNKTTLKWEYLVKNISYDSELEPKLKTGLAIDIDNCTQFNSVIENYIRRMPNVYLRFGVNGLSEISNDLYWQVMPENQFDMSYGNDLYKSTKSFLMLFESCARTSKKSNQSKIRGITVDPTALQKQWSHKFTFYYETPSYGNALCEYLNQFSTYKIDISKMNVIDLPESFEINFGKTPYASIVKDHQGIVNFENIDPIKYQQTDFRDFDVSLYGDTLKVDVNAPISGSYNPPVLHENFPGYCTKDASISAMIGQNINLPIATWLAFNIFYPGFTSVVTKQQLAETNLAVESGYATYVDGNFVPTNTNNDTLVTFVKHYYIDPADLDYINGLTYYKNDDSFSISADFTNNVDLLKYDNDYLTSAGSTRACNALFPVNYYDGTISNNISGVFTNSEIKNMQSVASGGIATTRGNAFLELENENEKYSIETAYLPTYFRFMRENALSSDTALSETGIYSNWIYGGIVSTLLLTIQNAHIQPFDDPNTNYVIQIEDLT